MLRKPSSRFGCPTSLERRAAAHHTRLMARHRSERSTDLDAAAPPASAPVCAWPGCDAPAPFRAPRSRDCLRDYQWLCLEHVREFNRTWDYFQGMSSGEIDQHRREDVVWHRPTWRAAAGVAMPRVDDPLGALDERFEFAGADASRPPRRVTAETERMLKRLGLDATAALAEVKDRYKALAKRFHPDLHGGDRFAEERLKLINEAYTYLLHCGELA